MKTALIGYTGFVGSNLASAHAFTDLYNSRNIGDIAGESYDLVVSAFGRADSHRINAHGEQDRAEIEDFIAVLSTVEAAKLVVVSTVCVYAGGTSPDERTPLRTEDLTPYGANRAHMERVLSDRFDALVLRLPQLYGQGLKKGIVYDLLHRYRVEHVRADGRFQYYDLRRLWADTQVALAAGLDALNVATPPLGSARVAAECFGMDIADQVGPDGSPPPEDYTRDMRTVHGSLFGGPTGYLMDEHTEMAALRSFVEEVRGR